MRVLNSMQEPRPSTRRCSGRATVTTWRPRSALKARLTREATVSWIIRDQAATVVRRGIDEVRPAAGDVRFVWDGTDDDGALVPEGRYTARIRVTSRQGTYAHDVIVRHDALPGVDHAKLDAAGAATPSRSRSTSAEPLKGKPVVTANQPGIAKYTVRPEGHQAQRPTSSRSCSRPRQAGKAGEMKVRVLGTDKQGGTQLARSSPCG